MIETHYGKVTNNNDPDKRGRVRVEAPTLVGKNKELPIWVEPVLVFMGSGKGFFAVPDKDSIVELIVVVSTRTDESRFQSSLDSPDVRYKPVSINDTDTLSDVFKTNYPNRRGMSTDAGHWYFDDTTGSKTFHLEHTSGAKLSIDNDGNIFITPKSGGKKIYLDDDAMAAPAVARVGDKVALHTHTMVFALTADLITGIVTGTITASSEEPAIAEGSSTITGGG